LFKKSLFWWIIAFIFTLSIAYYQRVTGPTYPVSGKIIINERLIEYKLLTSSESHIPAEIVISGNVKGISGKSEYRRFKSNDQWQTAEFNSDGEKLKAGLPPQPPAGKLEYIVILNDGIKEYLITEEPVVIRFKGAVPLYILIPHVIFMFTAMLFSTRTGIEALRKGPSLKWMTFVTLILLGLGGMLLGPIVQKFAFGEFWTGWPFGQDLTDNKTLLAFAAWFVAYLRVRKDVANRGWVIAASIILLSIFLIPHSMFGSELDHTTGEVKTGR